MKMYKTYQGYKIKQVNVIRKTEKSVWVIGLKERRRFTKNTNYFATLNEARAYQLKQVHSEINRVNRKTELLKKALNTLTTIKVEDTVC